MTWWHLSHLLPYCFHNKGYLLFLATDINQQSPHWAGYCLRFLSAMVCWHTSHLLPCLEIPTGWPPITVFSSSDSTDSIDSRGYDGVGFRFSGQSLSTVSSSFWAVCPEEATFLSRRSDPPCLQTLLSFPVDAVSSARGSFFFLSRKAARLRVWRRR